MDIRVLDTYFTAVATIDEVESIIWVEKYDDFGYFEIFTKYEPSLLTTLVKDYYLMIPNSDRVMIIEDISIKTNFETGNKLVIKGRSLESILDRRIVLHQLVIDTSLQLGIQAILDANVISTPFPERNIPNFVFNASFDPIVLSYNLKVQYYSENVFEIIKTLCQQVGIGFKITLDSFNQFIFSLYAGTDRSYDQTTYPYIIFSSDFDNLLNSEYFETKRYLKNYALVSGSVESSTGAPPDMKYPIRAQVWTPDVGAGLFRREMFVDAGDMPIYIEGTSTKLTEAVYRLQLAQKGYEALGQNAEFNMFEGSVDLSKTYTYGVDFFLGDIIQMKDDFGHSSRVRVTEILFSENLSGFYVYPTLKSV